MKILSVSQAEHIAKYAVARLAEYIKKSNLKSLVLGISGGLDSAVMSVIGLQTIWKLREEAYNCKYIYDFIDISSNHRDREKARELALEFGFILSEFDYTHWYEVSPIRLRVHRDLPKFRVAQGNMKCRIRMLHLYDRAQLFDGIVLDTDDFSEQLMGFWTKHGDVGDVKIIQHLTKDEVRDLGEYLGVPQSILDAAPGDGLGVTDSNMASDQLGMEYLKIDYIMSRLVENHFDYNGSWDQILSPSFEALVAAIAKEINESINNVLQVVTQSLRTGFKRKYGDDVANLLSSRTILGLPGFGTSEFNNIYLNAIRKQ